MALTSKAMASLNANYNPQGDLGGLFAPAYVPGYAPAEQAVMGWQSGPRPVRFATRADLDAGCVATILR